MVTVFNLFKQARKNKNSVDDFQRLTAEMNRVTNELLNFDDIGVNNPINISAFFAYKKDDKPHIIGLGLLSLGLPERFEYGYIVVNSDIDILLVDKIKTHAIKCNISGDYENEYKLNTLYSATPEELLKSGQLEKYLKIYQLEQKGG